MKPQITIGMVPRERFSVAAEALERLFALTPLAFRLVVVDCATPRRYWIAMERVLAGRDDVVVIHRDEHLLPNRSRNLVVQASGDSDWVCLLDNDVLVTEDWLSRLIAACEEENAQVAIPLILEGGEDGGVHFDHRLGRIRPAPSGAGGTWEIVPEVDYSADLGAVRRWQDCLEDHCVLYRRALLDRVTPFDETLNTREMIDLAMRIRTAGARVLFEPDARIVFLSPPPIDVEERDFFLFRWDRKRAVASNRRIATRWNIAGLPSSLPFVEYRRSMATSRLVRRLRLVLTPWRLVERALDRV